jgi:serine/threonine protein kinase
LVKEAIMLQKYQHKNIVKFIGISLLRKPFHLVIELVEGGSLSNVLRKNANINVRKKLKFSKNGAEALLYLENNNAVHLYVFV